MAVRKTVHALIGLCLLASAALNSCIDEAEAEPVKLSGYTWSNFGFTWSKLAGEE